MAPKKGYKMKIDHTDIINAPLERVYDIVKNELPQVALHLPNIKNIEVISSKKMSANHQITNRWTAEAKVPSLIKRFLKEDLFSWKDTALWNDKKNEVKYELESFVSKDIFDARGHNFFKSKGNKTELRLTCEVNIYPEKIPGVPRLIASKVQPAIEKLIKSMLEPNMTSLGEGIKTYLVQKN